MSSRATGGAEVRVNSVIVGAQLDPTIALLRDGGWIVTWTSEGEDGSLQGIFQRRFDAFGNALGEAEQVNSFALNDQFSQAVTGLTDGGWVVSWTSTFQDGSGFGIYQQRYDAAGQTVGPEQRVNSHTPGHQLTPSLVSLPDGGWIATWQSNDQDGQFGGIYQQRFDADGLPVGLETRVNSTTTSDQSDPSVAALGDGGWIVTWSSLDQDVVDTYGIYQQRYSAAGAAEGPETRVNTFVANYQVLSEVSALPDGGWVVVWSSAGQDGSSIGIYMQRYDSSGFASGPETLVNQTTFLEQDVPSIVTLADGGWIVAWQSNTGGQTDIFQQRYDANGVRIGGETRVNLTTGDTQRNVELIATPEGGWTVVWMSLGQDGDSFGIYQRHFAPDILGTIGDDDLSGTNWDELLVGYAGDDIFDGSGGRDVFSGGFGNDQFVVDSADDDVQELAGQGYDTIHSQVDFSLVGDAVEALILLGSSDLDGIGNEVANSITGNAGANTLNGNNGDDVLIGNEGNDILNGGTGHDHLFGGEGNDRLAGSVGRDTANYAAAAANITVNLGLVNAQNTSGAGTDTITDVENLVGSAFNDSLTGSDLANVIEGGAGDDVLSAGLGIDTASYASASLQVTVRMGILGAQNTFGAGIDTLSGFENIIGSAFSDVLAGDAAANIIEGGLGNDQIDGNGGVDTASYAGASSRVTISLAFAGSQNTTGAGFDALSSIENVIGSAFDDHLVGSIGNNQLDGGAGEDLFSGGAGADKLIGGLGRDFLFGGTGADRFIFDDGDTSRSADAADIIGDFSQAEGDRIALSQMDANSGIAGDQAFTFIGTAAFTATAGQLRYFNDGNNTFLEGDTNGDGFGDFVIHVDGLVPLVGADFIL